MQLIDLYVRLVSRDTNAKVMRTYTHRFFSSIAVLYYNQDSLNTAQEVARHPVFGPAITAITVYVDNVHGQKGPAHETGINIAVSRLGRVAKGFESILAALKLFDRLSTIKIEFLGRRAVQPERPKPLGIDRSELPPYVFTNMPGFGDYLHEIGRSVSSFGIYLKEFRLQVDNRPQVKLFGAAWSNDFFGGLEALSIPQLQWEPSFRSKEDWAGFRALLSSPNLKVLDIGWNNWKRHSDNRVLKGRALMKLLRESLLPELEELTISSHLLKLGALIEVVKRLPKLKKLNLRVVFLRAGTEPTERGKSVERSRLEKMGLTVDGDCDYVALC